MFGVSFSTAELKGKPSRRREVAPSNRFAALDNQKPPADNPKPRDDPPEWAQVAAWVIIGLAIWGFIWLAGARFL
jgi:hypothetical protein